MKVVNLYAGPGTGKSTICAALFAELKYEDHDVEMVREFAKDLVWDKRFHEMRIPGFILGEQSKRLYNVAPQVKLVITDGPILLTRVYDKNEAQKQLALDIYNEFDNLDIFLLRTKQYNPNGRIQNEQEAREKDEEILEMLYDLEVPFCPLFADRTAPNNIVEILKERNWI